MRMGFWIFMVILDLLFPLVMALLGKVFVKDPPKEINGVYEYRIYRSMKNKDTWEFVHHYFGKLWITMGWISTKITYWLEMNSSNLRNF